MKRPLPCPLKPLRTRAWNLDSRLESGLDRAHLTRLPLLILSIAIGACDRRQEPAPSKLPAPATAVTGVPELSGSVTYQLVDAEVRHAESPVTFGIPGLAERDSLDAGDWVKLVFEISDGNRTEVERMWVKVTGRKEDSFQGLLDNDPYCTDELKSGEAVTFGARHVIQINRANEAETGE